MRMIPMGRAFPAASLLAFTLAAIAMPASAQGIAFDADTVAIDAHQGARVAAVPGFTLIEHENSAAAYLLPNRSPAGPQMQAPPTRASAATYRAPKSSALRDRVILHIKAAEVRHDLPSGLLDALVAAESGYRPFAVSRAGAAGLAQLMPATAQSLGVSNRFDIRANLDGGARYLREMIDRFGSIATALAAYNAGPGAVLRAKGIPQNGETPVYVARVLKHWRRL